MAVDLEAGLIQSLAEDERKRLVEVGKRWDAFYGKHPKPLIVKAGRPDDNVIVNLCRLIVLKGTSFLFGKHLDWELEEGDETEEEAWLRRVWGRRRMLMLKGYGMDGGVAGHPFFRIKLDGMMGGRAKPRLILVDPACVHPLWEPDDFEKVYQYRIQYVGTDLSNPVQARAKAYRQIIDLDDSEQSWTITDQVSVGNSSKWETVATEPWPWPFAPVVGNQNLPNTHEFWGLSDLESDTIALNHGISAVISNMNKVIRLWSHPRTVLQGATGDDKIDSDPSGIIKIPGSANEQRMYTLEMAGDLHAAKDFLEKLTELFHEVARVPEVTTGRLDKVGQLSGLAMQILYEPLVELTEDKRETYGEALEDLNKRLLVIGGFRQVEDEYDITIQWPEIVPSDPSAEADTALKWEQLGVSRDTVQTRLGFNPELEAEKSATEQQAMGAAVLGAFNSGVSQVQPTPPQPPPGQ